MLIRTQRWFHLKWNQQALQLRYSPANILNLMYAWQRGSTAYLTHTAWHNIWINTPAWVDLFIWHPKGAETRAVSSVPISILWCTTHTFHHWVSKKNINSLPSHVLACLLLVCICNKFYLKNTFYSKNNNITLYRGKAMTWASLYASLWLWPWAFAGMCTGLLQYRSYF